MDLDRKNVKVSAKKEEKKIPLEEIYFQKFLNNSNRKTILSKDPNGVTLFFSKTGNVIDKTIEVKPLLVENIVLSSVASDISDPININISALKKCLDKIKIQKENFKIHSIAEGQSSAEIYTTFLSPSININVSPPKHWDEFLKTTSDGEAFAAWVWSVFSADHKGRQILYLQSEGETGKSTVKRVIQNHIKNSCITLDPEDIMSSNNNPHALADLPGKRLIFLDEFKTKHLIKSRKIKMITGEDPIKINQKYMPSYTCYIPARIWATSNFPLELENKKEQTSRLLCIEVKNEKLANSANKDPNFDKKLSAEFNQFLSYCYKCYIEKCPDNYHIVSEASNKTIKKYIDGGNSAVADITNEKLEVTNNVADFVSNSVLRSIADIENIKLVDLKNMLKEKGASEIIRFIDKKTIRGLQGVRYNNIWKEEQ